MEKPHITIIGLGQVGTALVRGLTAMGCQVVSAFNHSDIPQTIRKEFPATAFETGLPSSLNNIGDLIFITVSDDAIADVSEALAAQVKTLEGKMVAHCSGTHSSKILEPLETVGAKTASFHPMQAVTKSTNSFKGTWFDIEGDDKVLVKLENIAQNLNANTFRVEPEDKPFLHASAVVASNYLVVLADLVSRISTQGNVPEKTAIKALAPLMENTLQNIKELGVKEALTGPIARGDVETVRKHLESLKEVPDLFFLYKILGLEAVQIAEKKNGSSQPLLEIKKLLS